MSFEENLVYIENLKTEYGTKLDNSIYSFLPHLLMNLGQHFMSNRQYYHLF